MRFVVGVVILLPLHVCMSETGINLPVILPCFGILYHQQRYNLMPQEGPREILVLKALLFVVIYVIVEDVRRGRNMWGGEINL